MSSDDAIVFVDENWICESKFFNAFYDLVYFLVRVRSAVLVVRDKLRNVHVLNHDVDTGQKKALTRLTGPGLAMGLTENKNGNDASVRGPSPGIILH